MSIDTVVEKVVNSLDYTKVSSKIIDFLAYYLAKYKKRGYVLGLSGGLDSSVTAALAARMVKSDRTRVKALIMPHRDVTPKQDIQDAIKLAENLGIDYDVIDIADIHSSILSKVTMLIPDEKGSHRIKVADGNLSARLRMCLLYYYANANDALVLGTSDRSEMLIGYYTKYGDGAADLLPIAMLYKSQVRALARYLGIDEGIVMKRSGPMLWQDHYAEQELGMSYEEIDSILYCMMDLRLGIDDITRICNIDREKVVRVKGMVEASRHKRSYPKVCRIKE